MLAYNMAYILYRISQVPIMYKYKVPKRYYNGNVCGKGRVVL